MSSRPLPDAPLSLSYRVNVRNNTITFTVKTPAGAARQVARVLDGLELAGHLAEQWRRAADTAQRELAAAHRKKLERKLYGFVTRYYWTLRATLKHRAALRTLTADLTPMLSARGTSWSSADFSWCVSVFGEAYRPRPSLRLLRSKRIGSVDGSTAGRPQNPQQL